MESTWTLFLDRDGVINKRLVGDYVRQWEDFEFLDGVEEALAILARKFNLIVVVTNQQGVAKGLMTSADLEQLHEQMLSAINASGGKVHQVYACTAHEREQAACRKPNTGMALAAQQEFPQIVFERSIMVGDSVSDLQFGLALGMKTVLIETKKDINQTALAAISDKIDARYASLYEFALNFFQN